MSRNCEQFYIGYRNFLQHSWLFPKDSIAHVVSPTIEFIGVFNSLVITDIIILLKALTSSRRAAFF